MLISSNSEHGAVRVGGGSPDEPQLDIGVLVRKGIDVIRRRFVMLLMVTIGVFAIVVLLSMLVTPKYEAIARVKIDPKPMAASGVGSDESVNMPDQSVVDTEVSVMRSRDIATAVVTQLRLYTDPEFVDLEKSGSPEARMDAAVTGVLKATSIDREKTTYLVDIQASSTNAVKAANIANAFATAYIKATVSRRTGTAEEQRGWLDKRMSDLSAQSHSADAAVAQYKAGTGLTVGGTSGTITDQQIAPLSSQLATAQAANASAQSDLQVARSQMANGGSSAASSVLDSPALEGLRASRATTVQTISQLSSRYGPKHPQTIQAQQQLTAIDTQIQQEAERIVSQLDSRARSAAAQAGSLSGDLTHLRSEQGANARSEVTADALQRDADAKHSAYNNLAQVAQQIDQLSQNSMSQAQIIEQAVPATKPSSPRTLLLLGGGLIVALTVGTGVVGTQEIMSSGLLNANDVERVLGLGVLSSVPMLRGKDFGGNPSANPADAVIARPMSPYAEAFRVVRSSLALASETQPRVIGIASSLPAEGKTTSSISLARIMAMSGERTLLIDGDIRRARLQTIIKHRPAVGLVEVLRDDADPQLAIVADEVNGLDILSPSEASFLKEDLFSGDAMTNLLEKMRAKYDRIIIDTPPLLGVADARKLATLCDTVILAVKWNDTPRTACKLAANWLRQDHANIAGVMLTMVSPASEAFGALYYSKKYSEYYQTT